MCRFCALASYNINRLLWLRYLLVQLNNVQKVVGLCPAFIHKVVLTFLVNLHTSTLSNPAFETLLGREQGVSNEWLFLIRTSPFESYRGKTCANVALVIAMLGHLWSVRMCTHSSVSCSVHLPQVVVSTSGLQPQELKRSRGYLECWRCPYWGLQIASQCRNRNKHRNFKKRNFVGHIPYRLLCTHQSES